MTVLQTSVKNNKSYQVSGYLGGAGAAIGWTGTVTESVASVAGVPYTGAYTAYYGSLVSMAAVVGSTTWSNPALLALGAPYLTTGLAVWNGLLNTTAVETIGYAFTAPVPAGASFLLVDPGASYPSYTGSETYTISATYNGAAVSTSGWTFALQSPTSGVTYASTIAVNAAAGTVTVSAYAASEWPDAVLVITPNTPISSISVTAATIPYDFWALTLPHIPSALIFQSGNTGAAYSNAIALWQLNGSAIDGGGYVSNPGPVWCYAGQGDFIGNGSTSILFRNENGSLAYWTLSGTSVTSVGVFNGPGGTWSVIGVGDFNADGRSDLLFEDAAGDIGMWEMNGTSVIGGGYISTLSIGWRFLAVGDFNGNGASDILLENASGVLTEWLMNGASVSAVVTLGAPPTGTVFAGVGDFNGDGISDILFENPSTGQYSTWLMSSSGAVASTVTLCTPGVQETLVSIGAYTAASASDLVFDNTTTGMLTDYVINNATVTSVGNIGVPGSSYWAATAPDAATAPAPTVYFSDGKGDLATWSIPSGVYQSIGVYAGALNGWTFLAGGDFYGYGQPDFLAENASGNFGVFETNGSKILGGGSIGNPGAGWTYLGVGDFNGDGIEDILFQDAAGDLECWLLNGDTVIGGYQMGNPGAGYTLAAIADVNGNGISDLIFKDASGNYSVWFYANDAFAGAATIGNPGAGATLVGTGDFNGDGRADLLFQTGSNAYEIWELNGAAVVGSGAFAGPGAAYSYFGVAELGDSGCASVLFRNPANGLLVADNMFGASVVSTATIGAPGSGYSSLTVI